MNPRAWRTLLTAFTVGVIPLILVPGRYACVVILAAACAAGATACVRGPRDNGGPNRQPWGLFAGALAALTVAEVLQQFAHGSTAGWAVPVRALTVILVTMGLWLIVHDPPGQRRRSLIDPAIIAIGAGAVSWVFILDPIASRPDLASADRIVALAVPVLDMALLTVLVRFAFSTGLATTPTRLLAGGIGAFLAGDTVNSVATIGDPLDGGTGVVVLWVAGVGLIAAAALHPFMETLSETRFDREPLITTPRLVMLGLAAIAGPVAITVRSSVNARFNIPVVVAGTVVLFALILLRMAGLVRALGSTAESHAQANSREKILRRAAHALVAATDRQAIYATAADAAASLVRDREHAEVRLFIGDPDDMRLVARGGPRSGGHQTLNLASLPPRLVSSFAARIR